ncbi:MAG: hypothetical protein WBE92_05710 [Steroidobacteraceae bacterium]
MKNVLRFAGFGLIIAGLLCMPFPVTNPKAVTSLFPWLATSGLLVRIGAWATAIGAVLFALSFALRSPD